MAVNLSRYEGARETYFSGGKPPPIPPKEEKRVASELPSSSRRSPSGSPRHSSRDSGGSAHYTEYSHSVPRSRSKPHSQGPVMGVASKALRHGVTRSSSFTSSSDLTSGETPPSLPPRPTATPITHKTFKRNKPTFLTGDLSFEELIRQHQKSFPLRVYITNGYLGATSRLTISTGDMYNIHFLKRTRVMLFRDHHDTPYSIPLNSAIEFGLLYEPKEGRKPTDVETGVVFSSVADLLSQPETPKVVSVMKSWQSGDGKTSLVTNEVLVIKSVQRSLFTKKGMRVVSLTTKSDKFLSEECCTPFTTQPALCRLHITDIVHNLKQPKGLQCVLYLNSQVLMNRETSTTMQAVPDELFDKVLTIVDQVTETSLIASSLLHRRENIPVEDFDPDRDVLFDIPVDENTSEMTCAVVEIPDTTDTDRLYDDTKTLYEKFDPTRVMSVKDTGSEDSHAAQKLLYTTIRRGCEGLGVEIDRPEAVYDYIHTHRHLEHQLPTPPPSASPSPSPQGVGSRTTGPRPPTRASDSGGLDSYHEVTSESLLLSHRRQMPNPHIVSIARGNSQDLLMPEAGLGKKVVELEQQLQQSWLQVAGLHSRLEQSVGRVVELEGEVSRMKSSIEKLLPQIYALQSRLTHIATSPQRSAGSPVQEAEGERTTIEENKKHLKSLSSNEVCELLDAMELGQYKEAFVRECVSGEILLECDNSILESDLGVASRLHRLRLMKVIDGIHSAASLIEGADPYVTLGTS